MNAAALPAAIALSYFYYAFSFSITFAFIYLSSIVIIIFEITVFGSFGNLKVTSIGFAYSILYIGIPIWS